ncbi:Putative zinc finger/helix-turn-helix protein, YgiT family, partial [Dysosmobacter welbionis]
CGKHHRHGPAEVLHLIDILLPALENNGAGAAEHGDLGECVVDHVGHAAHHPCRGHQ